MLPIVEAHRWQQPFVVAFDCCFSDEISHLSHLVSTCCFLVSTTREHNHLLRQQQQVVRVLVAISRMVVTYEYDILVSQHTAVVYISFGME